MTLGVGQTVVIRGLVIISPLRRTKEEYNKETRMGVHQGESVCLCNMERRRVQQGEKEIYNTAKEILQRPSGNSEQ